MQPDVIAHAMTAATDIPSDETFLAEAAALLGPRGLTRDADLITPWLTDWRGRYTGAALALASPGSTAEVSALVKLCARHNWPLIDVTRRSIEETAAAIIDLYKQHRLRFIVE